MSVQSLLDLIELFHRVLNSIHHLISPPYWCSFTMEKYWLMLSFGTLLQSVFILLWSNTCMANIFKNMIFTCALGARVIRSIKSTKTEHKPIYFHSKPSTNMADNKAINAIKAHASCDHGYTLIPSRLFH